MTSVNHKYCDYESTTKNDLGVDSVSRKELLKIYEDRFWELQKLKHLKDNKGAEDRQMGVNYCINILKEFPPVTPQEPILDKIRSEIEEQEKMKTQEIKRILKSFAIVEDGQAVTIFRFDKEAFEQAIKLIEEYEELKSNVQKAKKVLEIQSIFESIEDDVKDAVEKLKKVKEIIDENPLFINDGIYQTGWNDGITELQRRIKEVLEETNNENR